MWELLELGWSAGKVLECAIAESWQLVEGRPDGYASGAGDFR